MRGIDGTSWNNKRPPGVVRGFQVRKHLIEAQADVPSNILGNDPSRPEISNNAVHLRPEMTVIFRASLVPGIAKRLARVSSTYKVN
jgi:hypothetical protein